MGWLVGVWLLRAPGERRIPKICLFPPGLIAPAFVNGKITSSLALAGGESSRLIQYLRKLHCRAQEAGGRNRLPVSVSAAGDNLCRHRLASPGGARRKNLTLAPGSLEKLEFSPSSPGLAFPGGALGQPFVPGSLQVPSCGWLCSERLRGAGCAHSMGIPLPFQPSHGRPRANGTCQLLTPHLPHFGCWRWGPPGGSDSSGRERDARKAFNPILSKRGQIHGLRHTEVTERRDWSHVALPQGQKLRPRCYSWLCPGCAALAPAGAAGIHRESSG